jgi:ABC-type branched-subunit amino acid transport system ATPase component/ABC-type branched-subunit amino acid transport system permease subunit
VRRVLEKKGWVTGSCFLILALLLPPWLPSFYVHILILMTIFAIFAMSLDILMGYAGLPSLGHAAFFGVGAYTVGLLAVKFGYPWWAAVLIALLLCTLTGALFGLVALRTVGLYFMLITLALGEILWGLANRWGSFTGGYNGLPDIPRPFAAVSTTLSFYYLALALFLVAGVPMYLLVRSPFGLSLQGIRDSESRMRMLGYNVWLHKYVAFVICGLFAGSAGIMSAYYNGFISPLDLSLSTSAEALLMVILGGAGTLVGPIIGAVVIVALRNFLSIYIARWLIVLGAIFIFTVLYAPDGVMGWLNARRRKSTAPGDWSSMDPTDPAEGIVHSVEAARLPVTQTGAHQESDSSNPVLRLDSVTKSFGGLLAVRDVSLNVRAGERVGILGPNGAGKTTLFHLVSGLLRPTSGRILLFDQDITRLPPNRRVALGLSRTYQITNLFPTLTTLDNLRLALISLEGSKFLMHRPTHNLEDVNERARSLLEKIGLWEAREVEVRYLSYGHQRQLEVVMALALQPKILLLDEPTAGLSTAEVGPIVRMIHSLPREITILIIEHDMDVAFEVAERILVFNHGEKLAEGIREEIRVNPDVRKIYLGRQAR